MGRKSNNIEGLFYLIILTVVVSIIGFINDNWQFFAILSAIIIAMIVGNKWVKEINRKKRLRKLKEAYTNLLSAKAKGRSELVILFNKISKVITTKFLIQPCTRCHETEMQLESISPKGRSISYTCKYCNKKHRASASSKNAELIINYWNQTTEYINAINEIDAILAKSSFEEYNRIETSPYLLTFETSEPVMPYEQTTRETIPENVKSEIWRRDQGKCVQCDSKNHLQFDHIIPVSKGGATSVVNLQLLCRSCNLKKGAKI